MKHTCTQLRHAVRSVLQLKVDGFCVTKATVNDDDTTALCAKSRCNLDGYDWEIRLHPALSVNAHTYRPGLVLVFLGGGEARPGGVGANLSGRITDKSSHCDITPSKENVTVVKCFDHHHLGQSLHLYIGVGEARDDCKKCTLTVECTITVRRAPAALSAIPVPPSDLPRHLGELLLSQAGADVTFAVSGKTFAAHKNVLAVRSPVFMAEFFGEMEEKDSRRVEIVGVDASAFEALLQFIYTDAVPELDQVPDEATTTALAQHLLVAADRYGLDRLKVMCERRLALGVDAGTVASTLALAEQHNCSRLKAKCVEFIAGGSLENLDAVLATEGYKELAASSPSVLAELLKATHGRKRCRSPDAK